MLVLSVLLLLANCKPKPHYEIVIRNGLLVDGTGAPGFKGDIAISGDTIAALGELDKVTADRERLQEVIAWEGTSWKEIYAFLAAPERQVQSSSR